MENCARIRRNVINLKNLHCNRGIYFAKYYGGGGGGMAAGEKK